MNRMIITMDYFFMIHTTIHHHLFQHFQLLFTAAFFHKSILNCPLLFILYFKLLFFYFMIFAKLNLVSNFFMFE